jgi:hypothetical protein
MADEPDRGEIETLRNALTRCAEKIRETVFTNDVIKSYVHMYTVYEDDKDKKIIRNFLTLITDVVHNIISWRRFFSGDLKKLILYKRLLTETIQEITKKTKTLYLLGMRDSCIGYIEEVIQLFDEQIRRLQRGGRRKSRTRKIKKQTRRSRSRSRSGARGQVPTKLKQSHT